MRLKGFTMPYANKQKKGQKQMCTLVGGIKPVHVYLVNRFAQGGITELPYSYLRGTSDLL